MERIRVYQKREKLLLEEAIQKAKEDTLGKSYLVEYLERKEFITMITKVLSIEEEIDLIRRDEKNEGIKIGQKRGERISVLNTVIILLKKKFKVDMLSDEISKKIEKASIEQLKKIRDDIFEIESLEGVAKYL